MNVGDSEIVVSIMQSEGWRYTDDPREADVILINTCSIRDNAEQRIWGRLAELRGLRRRRQGVEGAPDRRRGCRGYRSGARRLPRPAEAGARSRCGRQGDQRPAVARGDLRRDRTRAARPQRRERLRGHHARLQQLLLLLRGALHAGHRTQPRSRDDPRGGAVALRQRLPRGDAAGAERQLLPLRRGGLSRPDAPRGLHFAPRT